MRAGMGRRGGAGMFGRRTVATVLIGIIGSLCVWIVGCGADVVPAAEAGRDLLSDPSVSTSPLNVYTCATCHGWEARDGGPGAPLRGAAYRGGWWGGRVVRLRDAVNVCLTDFMGGAPLSVNDPRGRALFEALSADIPADTSVLPLTVGVLDAVESLQGDSRRGGAVWNRSCARCHGAAVSGSGRISPAMGKVPGSTIQTFGAQARAAVVEKVRHGMYFGAGGRMPPFSLESLSDQELADVLRYLGL